MEVTHSFEELCFPWPIHLVPPWASLSALYFFAVQGNVRLVKIRQA